MAALWSWYLALRGTHVFTFIYTYKHTHTQSYHLGNDEGVDVTSFSPYFFLFIFGRVLLAHDVIYYTVGFAIGHHEPQKTV